MGVDDGQRSAAKTFAALPPALRGAAATCVVALTVCAAAFSLSASTAIAAPTTVTVPVGAECESTGQLCLPLSPAGSYDSLSPLSIVYTAAATHCSNVAVRYFVDGKEKAGTEFVGAAQSTSATTVPWPNDGQAHELSVQGEGETGGCNFGGLGNWAGELTITYTPAPEHCQAPAAGSSEALSSGADGCCSISVVGRAARSSSDVLARLKVDRGSSARCQRKPVNANVDGQPVRLKFSGSHGEGALTMTGKREVCGDSLFARVSQGALSSSDEFNIPDSTPKITFTAKRDTAGQLQVKVLVHHVLPTAHCERPTVTVDGDVVRLHVSGSTATAHRAVISGQSCATVAKLQYQQDKVTATATREVTGAVPTLCKTTPP